MATRSAARRNGLVVSVLAQVTRPLAEVHELVYNAAMKKQKHPKRAAAYKAGFLDACLACIEIVMPIPHIERECAEIAHEILELMMRRFENE